MWQRWCPPLPNFFFLFQGPRQERWNGKGINFESTKLQIRDFWVFYSTLESRKKLRLDISQMAEQIATLCSCLGEYPSIRYRAWVLARFFSILGQNVDIVSTCLFFFFLFWVKMLILERRREIKEWGLVAWLLKRPNGSPRTKHVRRAPRYHIDR